jgi:FkbM family methyltransferase
MKPFVTGAKLIMRYSVMWVAAFSWSRQLLNAVYRRLTPSQKNMFHKRFSKVFRDSHITGTSGDWRVVFVNKIIRIPLTSEQFWLDWDTALSVVGQDIDIRQTYEALVDSSERPELFIDIGANLGTHSLLFLAHQIKTISFEPNTTCHDYFRRLCEANQVTPDLQPVALGERRGRVTLSYPRRDTWLGSTSTEVAQRLGAIQELVSEEVEQRTIDDYVSRIGHNRTLMKIDTEGTELSVLKGARRTLRENKPYVVFECWNSIRRLELFDFLDSRDYRICQLPWGPADKAEPLASDQFLACSLTNFIAIPTRAALRTPEYGRTPSA